MALLLVACAGCASCGASSGPAVDSNGFSSDVRQNATHLAQQDGVMGQTGITDYEVSFYRWSTSCQEGDASAGEIDAAFKDLGAHNIPTTRLEIMRSVANSTFTSSDGAENCAGDLAAYLTLRES